MAVITDLCYNEQFQLPTSVMETAKPQTAIGLVKLGQIYSNTQIKNLRYKKNYKKNLYSHSTGIHFTILDPFSKFYPDFFEVSEQLGDKSTN